MEEEMLSIVSNRGENVVQEAADSNGSVLSSPLRKHARHGSGVTPVNFKGVVPQKNGHWGAQIRANHQSLYSNEALLSTVSSDLARIQNQVGLLYTQLFEKELTPSDVGKWNRLVIPKKYAVKYFPRIAETTEQNLEGDQEGEVQLVFYDRLMRPWKFRYCYWKSSQSYVFTRGWNHFVKDKHLKSNDTVTFFLCKSREGAGEAAHFLMIDVNKAGENGGLPKATEQYVGLSSGLMLRLDDEMIQENNGKKLEAKEGEVVEATPKPKGFKLFGVLIE